MKSVFVPLFLLLSAGLFAAPELAVFREVKGKVEYQNAGAAWIAAKVGVAIPQGSMISTGFKGSASLEVLGSVIFIKPLTRMLLEELVRNGSENKTGLKLLAGKVKAEVKPSSIAAQTVFDVKSPTATASVRGTGFEFDGENILVNHGTVELANRWGQSRQVQGGEFSSAGKRGAVSPPIAVKPAEKPVITAEGGGDEVDTLVGDEPAAPLAEEAEGSEGPGADPGEAGQPAEEATSLPEPDLDLGGVIDTYGDDLFVDSGAPTPAQELKQLREETVAEQSVVLYQLTLQLQ